MVPANPSLINTRNKLPPFPLMHIIFGQVEPILLQTRQLFHDRYIQLNIPCVGFCVEYLQLMSPKKCRQYFG